MSRVRRLLWLVLVIPVLCGGKLCADPLEKEKFRERHPRRAEVNKRARNEARRIHQGVKSGELTPAEAEKVKSDLKDVKKEEREMVKENGGHLTKKQQIELNQKENAVSKEIYEEKHDSEKR